MKRKTYAILLSSFLFLFCHSYAQTSIDQWGFLGNRTGGWRLTKGMPGNFTISGANPLTIWAGIRGGFSTLTPNTNEAVVITGVMQFNGAGFDIPVEDAFSSTLRFGVFYSDSAGNIVQTSNGYEWSGTESYHAGYLFTPPSGSNSLSWTTSQKGTHGKKSSGTGSWLSTLAASPTPLGNFSQYPRLAKATAGSYNFAISIRPLNEQQQEIRFYLMKSDTSYYFGGVTIDKNSPLVTTKFNSFCIGLYQNNIDVLTSFQLSDVKVGYGQPIELPNAGVFETDTVIVQGDNLPNTGNLNSAIDAALYSGTLSHTVFKLELFKKYVLNNVVTIPAGEQLKITAPEPGNTQQSAPPQIILASNAGINKYYNFECYGDLSMKNVWLLFANTDESQSQSNIKFHDDPQANASGKGEVGIFDNVIFDYSGITYNASGAVEILSKKFKGTFKNCYFHNFTDPHYKYFGRAVSFPYLSSGWHIDSLTFENCTFANIGYVYSQEGNQYADYVKVNHCTFFNTLMYTLQSGWWRNLSVTNSIFTNTWMIGDLPYLRTMAEPSGGTINIDRISEFGFGVPFTESQRHIVFANCSYGMEPWLYNYFRNNPYSNNVPIEERPVPQPMMNEKTRSLFNNNSVYPYMISANLYEWEDPGFVYAPEDTQIIKTYLLYKWMTNADLNWAFLPSAGINQYWPMINDLSYTNDALKTGAMGNFPLGDLYHWWPSEYALWKEQETTENQNIILLMNGDTTQIVHSPVLLYPSADAKHFRRDSLTLKWSRVPDVNQYELQVSLSRTFNNTVFSGLTSDTTVTITDLQNFATYFWRVRSHKNTWVSYYSNGTFSVIASPPGPVSLVYPGNNQRGVLPDSVNLIWSTVTGASGYELQFSSDSLFTHIILTDITQDTTYPLILLRNLTTYYWRVRAYNIAGNGEFSQHSFTTISLATQVPVLAFPENNKHHIRTDSLMFIWNSSPNATGYKFQLSFDSLFTSVITEKENIADTTYLVTALEHFKKYYWRVLSYNEDFTGTFSNSYSFTTILQSPDVPILISPQNNLHYVRTDTLKFVWNSSANASGYNFQLSSDSLFSGLIFAEDSLSDTTLTLNSLESYKKYFWRVVSFNTDFPAIISNTYSFTTIVPIPDIPLLLSPFYDQTDVILQASFNWDSSMFAEKYHLQVSGDSIFTQLVFDTISVSREVTLSNPLEPLKFYYWHVSAIDTAGESAFSQVSKFKTGILVNVSDPDMLPKEFALSQNYPNPFNPSTYIKYSVPKESYVSLKVYNLLGEEVLTLFEGLRQPGNYTIRFEGSGLAGGVYIYQFRSNNFVETKKLILLK